MFEDDVDPRRKRRQMRKSGFVLPISFLILWITAVAKADFDALKLTIPKVTASQERLVTIDDVAALRNIDTLSVSHDGNRFAMFVRQGDPIANDYRTGWFVGSTKGGALIYVGTGGRVQPKVEPDGYMGGEVAGSESRWSPDGNWIAYLLEHDGELQLWRSRVDGGLQEQITHNASDVRDFAWSENGEELYFTAGLSRAALRAQERARANNGYRYDEEIKLFTDFMKPKLTSAIDSPDSVWVVKVDNHAEYVGDASIRAAFEEAQRRHAGGVEAVDGFKRDAAVLPVRRANGGLAWLVRSSPLSRTLRVTASLSASGPPITCLAEECSGTIKKVWWSADGTHVVFWRGEGINDRVHAFYAWSPSEGSVSTILRALDDDFRHCTRAVDRLICVRETPALAAHLAAINIKTGALQVVAEVNPEFHNIRLGKIVRYEWDTPKFPWSEPGGALSELYPKRAYGYILYPPGFDPSKRYPVFIDPYIANGFNRPGSEHALHVYAANGFVVLNMAFPIYRDVVARLGPEFMRQLYSEELDFPHLTMLMESTVKGLDEAASRGFIDQSKVGIGGVSQGTFIPLYMMQKHDRIAAISISSPTWGPHEYYWASRKGREWLVVDSAKIGYKDWRVKPEGPGQEFWSRFDIADHIETIEAPILMHLAAHETYALLRLMRHMSDEGKPYDAYIFRDETHVKWQPAHLQAIMNRNLDWFRFWLQDYEDPNPDKKEQYSRWHELREQRQKSEVRENANFK